jgi:hypothetical protein
MPLIRSVSLVTTKLIHLQAAAAANPARKGLSASRFANDDDTNGKTEDGESDASTAAGEEPDHSSAAMSAVRKPPCPPLACKLQTYAHLKAPPPFSR